MAQTEPLNLLSKREFTRLSLIQKSILVREFGVELTSRCLDDRVNIRTYQVFDFRVETHRVEKEDEIIEVHLLAEE